MVERPSAVYLGWEPIERNGRLIIVRDLHSEIDLGLIEPALDRLAKFIADRVPLPPAPPIR